MGLLTRVRGMFGGGDEAAAVEERECLHGSLMARWDSSADMGDESKATSFVCSSCNERFTPEEAADVRKRAVERLRG
jgi:hypothetical protein